MVSSPLIFAGENSIIDPDLEKNPIKLGINPVGLEK
jgi:hypothetical protein